VSGQNHALVALPPGKFPAPQLIGGWVGPRDSLEIMEKKKFLPLPVIKPRPTELCLFHSVPLLLTLKKDRTFLTERIYANVNSECFLL
jgi:hypothetical protein